MRFLRAFLAAFSRPLPVRPSESDLEGEDEQARRGLPANFAAIAINGFCFPTAGRILGAGLLLTWFVSDLTPSATLVGIIVPIQYGLALIAQPLFAEWLSAKGQLARYYTAQSLLRATLWCALGAAFYLLGDGNAGLLLSIFFAVIVVDAVAAGVGNIVFSDTLARVIPRRLRGRARIADDATRLLRADHRPVWVPAGLLWHWRAGGCNPTAFSEEASDDGMYTQLASQVSGVLVR